ncbi:NAD(P)-dependent oxidoreductase [Undibacterium sp.]|jgi:nucleoside-diphosphate-sugar epimerase|uniref:NAD-dependent epimerase/dehydratase family protein n=1 Tax=Undibacterium sp. TaxID=1914977 RepID=UPI002C47936C|nr:NAD(P)-dependent oxidoreductase [Undibacterium sp.]HTD05642.1 NAD(P)-dependent oxidoreductase [Undibacterium sp.]
MAKILLTGAAGFLGRECMRQFKETGYDVVTTDRLGEVDYIGDLSDVAFCAHLPNADAVVHCAAVQYVSADLPLFFRDAYFEKNNVAATRNLCQRYANASTHFVHVGTSMMYLQNGAEEYSPASPMRGQGVYSISKLNAQKFVDALDNPTATVIPCIIGGIGREGLFRGFVRHMQRFGMVVYPGAGSHKVHMVHVEDVAGLIVCIVNAGATGKFNAAAPNPLSIEQWVDEMQDELSLPKIRRLHVPLAPIQFLSRVLGYRLLAREQLLMLGLKHTLSTKEATDIGWTARHDNKTIVRDIARHISSS